MEYKTKKPKILFIINRPHWTLDFIADDLIKYLSPFYIFKKRYCSNEVLKKEETQKYDLIFVMFPNCVKDFNEKSSIFVTGIQSYACWYTGGKRKTPSQEYLRILQKFKCIHTICRGLYHIFKTKHSHVFYVSIGINTKLFKPKRRRFNKVPVLGFVGNPKHYGDDKGYYEFIEPVFKKIKGVKLESLLRGIREVPREKLPYFYNKLDALICMSRSEGLPTPLLEAMSCGTPCITTNVGIVPEVVKDGRNGRVIKRTKQALIEAVEELKDNRILYRKMGEQARKTITKDWSWEKRMKDWKSFFDSALNLKK